MKKLIPKYQRAWGPIVQQDAIRSYVPEKPESIKLTAEQQQNLKLFGTLNKPEPKKTYISQGRKLTPAEQKASDKKLKEQENLQNYQKQKEKEAHDLQHAVEVVPYLIPGLGQAMWAGKAVDIATNKLSNDKYQSWGDMIDKNVGGSHTGIDKFAADLTNPGYYAGALVKVASPLIKKGTEQAGKYLLEKAEPYLSGNKKIPMMPGYKPQFNITEILENSKSFNIPKDVEITKDNIDNILSNMGKETGGAFTEGSYKTNDYIYLLKNESEHSPNLVTRTNDLPKNIMPVHQSLTINSPTGIKNIQLQTKASGNYLHKIPENDLNQLTQLQIDEAKNAINEASAKGLEFDFHGDNNVFYDPKKGFQFIDFDASGNTNFAKDAVEGFRHNLKRGITKTTDYPADYWLTLKNLKLGVIPATGLYGLSNLTQSKKRGGKLLPRR